jgi:ABC-type transport system substrate-binding protein
MDHLMARGRLLSSPNESSEISLLTGEIYPGRSHEGGTPKVKRKERDMTRSLGRIAMVGVLLGVIFGSAAPLAQKQGRVLRVHALDSPPSLSMLEEADAVPARATMGLFNNLVMFDQHAKQNNMQSIIPDLATGWSWSEDGTQLTFPLREGVKWHDGKPFTAEDVKCTWDLLTGKSSQKLRSIRASLGTTTSRK